MDKAFERRLLEKCELCPRKCGADRFKSRGFCGAGARARLALVSLHPWEEPCLVGEKGAGTVFFSHCNLRCAFCQNYEISEWGKGLEVTDERLAEIFLEQEERGAATLDLVTPTHFAPQIARALELARREGLTLPVVYNSSAYETEETLALFTGLVDVFLPDLKFFSAESATKYAAAPDYPEGARRAIRKMYELAGPLSFGEDGTLKKGVIVRHLVLPGGRHESMEILDWLYGEFGDKIQISLMSQYTPMHRAKDLPPLHRRLTSFEYDSVVEHALELGITRCYTQERRAASVEYVPSFDFSGVR